MNLPASSGGFLATVVSLTIASGLTVRAQEPPSPKPPADRTQPQNQGKQQSLGQIASTYRELQNAALNVLQAQSRNFRDTSSSSSDTNSGGRGAGNRDAGDVERNPGQATGAKSATASLTLRGDQMLIAACPNGLLAGAPTRDSTTDSTPATGTTNRSTEAGDERTGSSADVTPPAKAGSDQTVGLILVCEHSKPTPGSARTGEIEGESKNKQTADASIARSSGRAEDASGGTPTLQPGTYAIKRQGNSVWLADESGKIALRAMIESKPAHTPSRNAASADRQPAGESPTSVDRASGAAPSTMRSSQDDWELVFGAITKEVMTSMGWAKTESATTRR